MTSRGMRAPSRVFLLSLRVSAMLLVLVLFALLTYRLVHGSSGAGLTRAINAHRSPAAPNVRLSVIWPRVGTWPQRLRASVDAGTLRLADLRGYPVVLNFWASWCSPCQREAPLLASAAEARSGQIIFIGVDVHDPTSDARHFLRAHHVPYVVVDSKNSITERFGLIGLPETFYVDRRGRIEDATRGELTAATLQKSLDRASHD
jgi:cytochrome c biogenesis protein CcmG, thiol:disulfide interchange protein DsbE